MAADFFLLLLSGPGDFPIDHHTHTLNFLSCPCGDLLEKAPHGLPREELLFFFETQLSKLFFSKLRPYMYSYQGGFVVFEEISG